MKLTEQQQSLFQFVKIAHGDQIRKYTGEPYWNHLYEVAEIVDRFDKTEGLIEVALCHDLFEDTTVDYASLLKCLSHLEYTDIESIFILRGVMALTDTMTHEAYPEMNRAGRKNFEAHRLGKIAAEYQTVKYADFIHNTKSIVMYDKGFAKKYLAEKRYTLNLMRMGNIELFIECYQLLVASELSLVIHEHI